YFPIDPAYDVPATLEPSNDQTIGEMKTSSGAPRKVRIAGTLVFTLKGQQLRITAFHDLTTPAEHLSVMFSDLTSGTETYAAGRLGDFPGRPRRDPPGRGRAADCHRLRRARPGDPARARSRRADEAFRRDRLRREHAAQQAGAGPVRPRRRAAAETHRGHAASAVG